MYVWMYVCMDVWMYGCHTDEAENRIQKKLGIEFKKGLNSNLIPTCLVFIDLKKGLNSNLIPTCLLFI